MTEERSRSSLSVTRGGPLFRLLERGGLLDDDGAPHWTWLALFAWLPLVTASLARLIVRGSLDPVARDPSVHVRFLVTLPLIVLAERLLEGRCASATYRIREERLADHETLDDIFRRAERWRDSRIVEGLFTALVLIVGVASLLGLAPGGGLLRGEHQQFSIANLWYLLVALPLLQLLMLRWLWRWTVWTYVLVRLSRSRIATNPLHPDHASGLGILSTPIDAFAIYVGAIACLGSAAWIYDVVHSGATLHSITPSFVAFVVLVIVIACGPLMVFLPHLYQVRHQGFASYHAFAHEYVGAFRRKWIHTHQLPVEPGTEDLPSPALGTADIQSLNDLIGSFGSVSETRLYPFGARSIVYLLAGAVLPMIPLVLASMPVKDIAAHLGKMMFGLSP